MNKYFSNWTATRIIQLIVGIVFGAHAIMARDYPFLILSIFFLIQAVFGISFCQAMGGCKTSVKQEPAKEKKFTDEFIKYKKK
jgi:hypothetical protein